MNYLNKMKKNKENKNIEAKEEVFGNLFADLKVNLPPPPEEKKPEPPPEPTKEEKMVAGLSRDDKALLEVFNSKGNFPVSIGVSAEEKAKRGPRLTFAIQRKGHKGKTVTLVNGLKEVSVDERMVICSEIKSALGVGARFLDMVLELQGDQRERAAAWFQARGFRCE